MKYLFTLHFLLLFTSAIAQQPDYSLKENSTWTFGSGTLPAYGPDQGTGLKFNGSLPPTVISSVALGVAGVAQASVSDTNGNLLFYTDGSWVLDANNNIMPNGDTLVGDTALFDTASAALFEEDLTTVTTQGALIIPVIGNPHRYYVLSLTSSDFDKNHPTINPTVSKGVAGELFYSVVDMTLDNGLGDVLTSQRGIFLDSNLTESMVAVAGTHCDVWILVHAVNEPTIYAFNVNAAGINPTPVVSHCGNFATLYLGLGAMKVSPDRKKIAVCTAYSYLLNYFIGGTELCDFDPATGIVSNAVVVTNTATYQACFSPDNSKLYTACLFMQNPQDILYQYDLTNNFAVTQIASDGSPSEPQLAPDGKIYFLSGENYVDCIASPDLAGSACNYTHNAINIGLVSNGLTGIHNLYVKPIPDTNTLYVGHADTTLCASSGSLVLYAPGFSDYLWSNDSTDSIINVFNTSILILRSTNNCETRIDTFKVTEVSDVFTLGPDTSYCSNSFIINAPIHNAAYLWQDGSTANMYQANSSGAYSVEITDSGCTYTDTINISLINVQQNLGDDTTLCANGQQQITLKANVPDGALATWSNGSNNAAIVADTGTYWITVTDGVCMGSDTIHVESEICNCTPFIPTAFTPNNDGKNDVFKAVFPTGCNGAGYTLSVYNRWGQKVFTTNDASNGWDGTFHGVPANIDTYMYTMQFLSGPGLQQIQYQKGDITLVR